MASGVTSRSAIPVPPVSRTNEQAFREFEGFVANESLFIRHDGLRSD